jgi:ParB-like chromosome segregation protein Spo0J
VALSYIRDRIKGFQRIKAKDLLPNERNWRIHPPEQESALKGILSEIGFAGAILVRPVVGGKFQIIDGHLRAKTAPNMDIPVLVTDLSPEEADKLLLTYDPISAMALADKARIDALLASVRFENKALGPLLEKIAGQRPYW